MSNRKLEYVNKTIQVSDITIKNVPVLKDDRDFEDTIPIDTLIEIYRMIDENSNQKVLDYKGSNSY